MKKIFLLTALSVALCNPIVFAIKEQPTLTAQEVTQLKQILDRNDDTMAKYQHDKYKDQGIDVKESTWSEIVKTAKKVTFACLEKGIYITFGAALFFAFYCGFGFEHVSQEVGKMAVDVGAEIGKGFIKGTTQEAIKQVIPTAPAALASWFDRAGMWLLG